MVNPSRNGWSRLLEDILWAHRTAYWTLLGMSPYQIDPKEGVQSWLEAHYKPIARKTMIHPNLRGGQRSFEIVLGVGSTISVRVALQGIASERYTKAIILSKAHI
ncbi:hypothetical protein CR513_33643, partial [Mucuna pruriens]